jgi:hypothetical protein
MPKNPTQDEKVAWHLAYAKNCNCRPLCGKNFGRNKEKRIGMTIQFIKDTFVWGVIIWLIGYLLGIILFAVVPYTLIGWVIMPIGILVTFWVLLKKVKVASFQYYILVAVVWTLIAVLCDYIFLVKIFKPVDGYYKLDVYLYYAFTFTFPLLVGWKKVTTK